VALFRSDLQRRILIEGEHADIEILTSLDNSKLTINVANR